MLNKLIPAFIAIGASTLCEAQFTSTGYSAQATEIEFTLGEYNLTTSGGFTVINDKESTPILEKGAPALPKYAVSIILPATGNSTIEVIEGDYTEYTGITIAPSKGSLKRNVHPNDITAIAGIAYAQNTFYPAQRAQINKPFIFRGTRGASIHVYPYAYNPITKVLRVYKKMHLKIVHDYTSKGENQLESMVPLNASTDVICENMFVNYSQYKQQMRYTPMEEKGKMLIITPSTFSGSFASFTAWKAQRGIETELVTTATTGTTQSAIKNYISTYYTSNPDLMFVLLVGDHENLPAYNAGSTGWETKWSDSYYGFISGSDHYPEVFIGRLPAKNTTQLTTMLTKIMEYEKTPSTGTWYHNSIGIGSDEGAGIGDEGEADWQHMRNIRTELMGFGYTTVHEFYDGSHGVADASGDPNNTMVAAAVETGASLFLYCGHGAADVCVTSNYSTSDIASATNYGKYPFVVSVACNNGTFAGGECLTEEFMRASNTGGPTGAIAACGSSILMAWAEPMETEDEISKILSQLIPGNVKYTLGGLFYNGQMSMLESYPTGTGEEVMETWVMFGDPSVMMRSKTPQTMSVSSPACYNAGNTLSVTGGISGADVALSQAATVLVAGNFTGSSASINVPVGTTGPVTLTVSGYNQIPYVVTLNACAVGMEELNEYNINVFPNPVQDRLTITNVNSADYFIYDQNGKLAQTGTLNGTIDVSELTNGLYVLRINNQSHRFIKN